MIKYLLACNNKHEFESWFSESKEYEKLKKRNLIECIFCKSKNVNKSIMSPNIVGKNKIVEKKFNSNSRSNTQIKRLVLSPIMSPKKKP